MFDDFAKAAVAFFAVIDPIGNILVFEAVAGSAGRRTRALIALVSVAISFALLALFALAGEELLNLLGISMQSFTIAAGILLLLPAIRLVESGEVFDTREREPASGLDAAVVPLALPMLSGPGTLALATTFAAQFGRGITLGAAGVVLLITLALFLAAATLTAFLHPAILRAAARVVGVILVAIAVNFIVTGWQAL